MMRRRSVNAVLALLFSAAVVFGWQIEHRGNANFYNIGTYAWLCGVFVSVLFLLSFSDRILIDNGISEKKKKPLHITADRRLFLMTWGGMILSYGIALLGAFPGFFCYDAQTETFEVMTNQYSNHHPIVHEFLLGNALRVGNRIFGNYNAGITLVVVAQIPVIAAIFSYMLYVLAKRGISRRAYLISALFIALFPTVSMFAVCTTKDVPFTAGIILFTAVLYDRTGRGEENAGRDFSLLFAASCLILLFRNNGIYILIPTALIFICVIKKKTARIVSGLSIVCAVCVCILVTQTMILSLHATRGELKEMLSVPMQQLARVYRDKTDELSKPEKEILFELIPEIIIVNYNPKCADDVKVNFLEDQFKSDIRKYSLFYLKMLTRYPDVYVNAFLEMSYGYYYPRTVISGYEGKTINGMTYGDSSYFQFVIENPGQSRPVLKFLNRFFQSLSLDSRWQKNPVTGILLHPATYFWVFVYTLSLTVKKKRRDTYPVFLVSLLNFAIMLMGPMALVRYALHFYILAPLMLHIVFTERVSEAHLQEE